jgi:lipoate synthase
MTDDSDESETLPSEETYFDGIAERVRAYAKLFQVITATQDDDLKKEGLQMLASVRKSFKQVATGELHSIAGGRIPESNFKNQ